MIRVTIVINLPNSLWGADELLASRGAEAVKELCMEDIQAALEGAEWKIEPVNSEPPSPPLYMYDIREESE